MKMKPCAKAPILNRLTAIIDRDPMIVSRPPGHPGPSVSGPGSRDKVEGVRQGAQGTAPSLASLEPPWTIPGAQKSERGPGRSRCVSGSVM